MPFSRQSPLNTELYDIPSRTHAPTIPRILTCVPLSLSASLPNKGSLAGEKIPVRPRSEGKLLSIEIQSRCATYYCPVPLGKREKREKEEKVDGMGISMRIRGPGAR